MFVTICIALFISPLLALFYSFYQSWRTKKTYYIFSAASVLAFFYAITPLSDDAFRYFLRYHDADWILLVSKMIEKEDKLDFLYEYLSIAFRTFGADFFIFRFFMTLSAFFCWAWILKDIIEQNAEIQNDKKLYLSTLLIFLLAISGFGISFGVRYGPAMLWMVCACYMFSRKMFFSGVLLASLSCALHFSMLPFAALILLSFLFQKISIPLWLRSVMPIVLILSSDLLKYAYDIAPVYENIFNDYITGFWGEEYVTTWSWLLYADFKIAVFIVLYCFFINKEKFSRSLWNKIIIFSSWLVFLCFNYANLKVRYANFCTLLLIADFCLTAKCVNRRKILFCVFLLSLLQLQNFYAFRRSVFNSVFAESFLRPAIVAVADPFENGWSVFADCNLLLNGSFRSVERFEKKDIY